MARRVAWWVAKPLRQTVILASGTEIAEYLAEDIAGS
jgi:hypothetical protein